VDGRGVQSRRRLAPAQCQWHATTHLAEHGSDLSTAKVPHYDGTALRSHREVTQRRRLAALLAPAGGTALHACHGCGWARRQHSVRGRRHDSPLQSSRDTCSELRGAPSPPARSRGCSLPATTSSAGTHRRRHSAVSGAGHTPTTAHVARTTSHSFSLPSVVMVTKWRPDVENSACDVLSSITPIQRLAPCCGGNATVAVAHLPDTVFGYYSGYSDRLHYYFVPLVHTRKKLFAGIAMRSVRTRPCSLAASSQSPMSRMPHSAQRLRRDASKSALLGAVN
jgi:hypothetical protein